MFLIAGPCAIESRDMVMHTAETLKQICDLQPLQVIPPVYSVAFSGRKLVLPTRK